MLYRKKFFLFIFFSNSIFCVGEKYVIGTGNWGFFACFFNTLSHIKFCELNNKTPVVYWGKECPYYDEQGHNGNFNAWTDYFEQISSLSYMPGDVVNGQYLTSLPLKSIGDLFAYSSFKAGKTSARNEIRGYINKYINVKQNIKDKINNFYNKFINGKPTIGIHLRGTDKITECIPVPPQTLLAHANTYKGYQYFIATDEEQLLELAKKTLKGNVIHYDSIRSKNGQPVHFCNNNKYKAGEDILIESILLSSCNKFIHTSSNVSMAVLCFNPELENIVFPVKFVR